jgi:hypothetical protein
VNEHSEYIKETHVHFLYKLIMHSTRSALGDKQAMLLSRNFLPMAHSSADRRRVFLAYPNVFTGPLAHIRKSKKVREVLIYKRSRRSFCNVI